MSNDHGSVLGRLDRLPFDGKFARSRTDDRDEVAVLDRAGFDALGQRVGGAAVSDPFAALGDGRRLIGGNPNRHFGVPGHLDGEFAVVRGAAIPNLYVREAIRDSYEGWHRNLVTGALSTPDGRLPIPDGPDLGISFEPSLLEHPDTRIRRTEA